MLFNWPSLCSGPKCDSVNKQQECATHTPIHNQAPTLWRPKSCRNSKTEPAASSRCTQAAAAAISMITHAKSCLRHEKFKHRLQSANQGLTCGRTPAAAAVAAAMRICTTVITKSESVRAYGRICGQTRALPNANTFSHAISTAGTEVTAQSKLCQHESQARWQRQQPAHLLHAQHLPLRNMAFLHKRLKKKLEYVAAEQE